MDKPRTIFGHPIRAETTAAFFPDRITLEAFGAWMEGGAQGYVINMTCQPTPWAAEPHYIEEWIESWLAWSEIETE